MPMSYLWLLASAAVFPLIAGSQGAITNETLGGSWETDRRVRVSRAHGPQQEDDDSMAWEGTVHEWCEAVCEAAARPSFPGTVEGWEPRPVEAAYRAALTTDRAPGGTPMDRAETAIRELIRVRGGDIAAPVEIEVRACRWVHEGDGYAAVVRDVAGFPASTSWMYQATKAEALEALARWAQERAEWEAGRGPTAARSIASRISTQTAEGED